MFFRLCEFRVQGLALFIVFVLLFFPVGLLELKLNSSTSPRPVRLESSAQPAVPNPRLSLECPPP